MQGLWKAEHVSTPLSDASRLLGRFKPVMYGALLLVKVEASRIVGFRLEAPRNPDYRGRVRRLELFEMTLPEGEPNPVCRCLVGADRHEVVIEETLEAEILKKLTRRCLIEHRAQAADLTDTRLVEEDGLYEGNRSNVTRKLKARIESYSEEVYERLTIPIMPQNCLSQVPAGLFKGTVENHGVQIFQLSYSEDEMILGKITGDFQVPAGKIMIIAWMTQPANRETFLVPENCREWRMYKRQVKCIGSFRGKVQRAQPGYVRPSWHRGELLIFDGDHFCFYQQASKKVNLFHRIFDDELAA